MTIYLLHTIKNFTLIFTAIFSSLLITHNEVLISVTSLVVFILCTIYLIKKAKKMLSITTYRSFVYHSLFNLLADSKQATLVVNNNLEIIYLNKAGQKKFLNHRDILANYIRNLPDDLSHQFMFNDLNPIHNLDPLLTKSDTPYINRINYGDLGFVFMARPIKILNSIIGFIVEFTFEVAEIHNDKQTSSAINTNIINHYLPKADIEQEMQRLRLDLINFNIKHNKLNKRAKSVVTYSSVY